MPEGSRKIGAEVFVEAKEARDELKGVQDDVKGVGTAAKEGSDNASAAMNGVASSAKAAAAAFGATGAAAGQAAQAYQQNRQEQQALDVQMAGLKQRMAALNIEIQKSIAEVGREAEETRELAKDYAMLDGELRILRADKTALTAASRPLADAARTEAAAARAAAAAGNEHTTASKSVEDATKKTGEATGVLTKLFTEKTNAVRTSGTIFEGYDHLLQAVIGSTGGITIALTILLTVVGAMIPKIIELVTAKKELAKVDADYSALTTFNLQNGSLVVQMYHEQTRSSAALTASILQVVENQRLLNKEADRGAELQAKLLTANTKATNEFRNSTVGYGAAVAVNMKTVGDYQEMLAKSAETQQGFTKEIAEGLKGIDAYRAITHQGAEAVIAFAQSQRFTNEQLDFLKQALDEDVRKMGEFASESAKAATHTRSLAEATIAFNLARATAKAPGFSNGQFATTAETARFAQDIATNLQAATGNGATFREAVLNQQGPLRDLQKHFRETTLSVSGYNAEVAKLPDIVRKGLVELDAISKGMKVFADHTKQAAVEERQLENTAFQMRKELLSAEEQLGKLDFDKRRALVHEEFEDRRQMLLKRKQLTQETSAILVALEVSALAQITNAEVKHYQEESERRRRDIEQQNQRMDRQRQARIEMDKQYRESIEYYIRLERQLTAALEEESLKRTQAVLKAARDQASARIAAGKFLLSQGQGSSSAEIDRFLGQLKQLGPAFQDVDKGAQQTRAAIDYVRNAFDFSSHSAQMFQLKLDLLTGHSVSFGQVFRAVFSEVFLTVQAATAFFEGFGQAISNVFEGMVTGTQNAKAAFLNFLAAILMQMGQMAIAIGTIFLFIPGHQGLGAGLIAAGVAAMALAGVFRGLASNAQRSGSAAATGGSGAAASGASQRAATPPTVIPFPTSPSGGARSISLDRQGTKDFLNGHEVLTRENAKTKYRNDLKKAVA